MNTGTFRPGSVDAAQILLPYCGGFVSIEDHNHKRIWAVLETINPEKGVFMSSFCYEYEMLWHHARNGERISFAIQGVMIYEKGGEFELFGKILRDNDLGLLHVYTPLDSHGRNSIGEEPSVNYFYYPDSKMVPEEVMKSYMASRRIT